LVSKPQWLPPEEAAALVPAEIYDEIWQENTEFFRDKNLFDTNYFEFLWNVVLLQYASPVEDYTAELDANSPWMRSIELGVRFICETLSHAKEKGLLPQYIHQLKGLFSSYIPGCKWFLEKLIDDPTWLKELLLECSVPETSEQFAKLIVHVLGCLAAFEREKYDEEETVERSKMDVDGEEEEDEDSEDEIETRPSSYVVRFLQSYLYLLDGMEKHWKRFAHYFMVLRDFAKIGDKERELFLQWNLIRRLGDFYLGADALSKPKKKKKIVAMGEKKNPPKLEFMVGLFSVMVRGCGTETSDPPPTSLSGTILELPKEDKKLIYHDGFWKKLLGDGINPKECAEIAVHLCWENEPVSNKFIDYVTHGIDVSEYDKFGPFFELGTALLTLDDSLHQKRIDNFLAKYLIVIQGNQKYRAATREAIKFLVGLAPVLPPLRMWLHNHISQWLETWLLASIYAVVREEAESLVMSLAPSANSRLVEEKKKANKDFVHEGVTEEDQAIVHEIFKKLLALLHSTRRYKAGDPSLIKGIKNAEDYPLGYWKLTGYFRLLTWCVQGTAEKNLFEKYFDDFSQIFTFIDREHLPCDENKKELLNFWYAVTEGHEKNVQLITENAPVTNHLFDLFASLNSKERVIVYNEEALPPFYNLLFLCCAQDKDFLARWTTHTNFYWAVSNMYIATSMYHNVGASLYRILQLAVLVPEHRAWGIVNVIKTNGLLLNTTNNLKYLEMLLKGGEDVGHFVEQGGLEQLSKLLSEKVMMARKEEDMLTKEEVELCLHIAHRAIQCLEQDEKQTGTIIQAWESKGSFVDAVVHVTNRWSHQDAIVLECYKVLSLLSNADASNYTLQKGLQSQRLELQEMMEILRGRGRASHLHHHPQLLPFIGGLCSLAFERLKDEAIAEDVVSNALMAATWATSKGDAIPSVLLSLLLKLLDDSESVYGQAMKKSDHIGAYLTNVFRSAPRKMIDGDTALFVARLLPHAIAIGNVDVAAVAEELATDAQAALSRCSAPTPALDPTQDLASLRNVLTALRLLFVSEEAKSFILASQAGLFEKLKQVFGSESLFTGDAAAELQSILLSFS